MKIIKLVNSKNGWLARYENDEKIIGLFGTDTISTAFTENTSPMKVLKKISKLNPDYKVLFVV